MGKCGHWEIVATGPVPALQETIYLEKHPVWFYPQSELEEKPQGKCVLLVSPGQALR